MKINWQWWKRAEGGSQGSEAGRQIVQNVVIGLTEKIERMEVERAGLQARIEELTEQLGIKRKFGKGMAGQKFEEALHDARGMNLTPTGIQFRNGQLWHLIHDGKFPAVLGLIDELREDLHEEGER